MSAPSSPPPPPAKPPKHSGPRFTREQRKRLELLAVDTITYDLSEKESMRYIALRAPDLAMLDEGTLRRYRKKVRDDPYYEEWLSQFVKVGYVRMYKDRIDEMLAIQNKAKRMLLEEEALPASPGELEAWKKAHPNQPAPRLQNPGLKVYIMSQITAANKRLTELQNSGPVAAKMHAILQLLNPDTPEEERKRVLEQMLASAHG